MFFVPFSIVVFLSGHVLYFARESTFFPSVLMEMVGHHSNSSTSSIISSFFRFQIGVFLLLQQFSINLNLIHYVEQPRMLRQFKRKQTLNMLAGCWIVLESLVWSPVYAVLDTYASPAAAKHDCLLERKR